MTHFYQFEFPRRWKHKLVCRMIVILAYQSSERNPRKNSAFEVEARILSVRGLNLIFHDPDCTAPKCFFSVIEFYSTQWDGDAIKQTGQRVPERRRKNSFWSAGCQQQQAWNKQCFEACHARTKWGRQLPSVRKSSRKAQLLWGQRVHQLQGLLQEVGTEPAIHRLPVSNPHWCCNDQSVSFLFLSTFCFFSERGSVFPLFFDRFNYKLWECF